MTEHLRNEIVRRWQNGTSQRVIARSLGVSRGAVRRALSKHQQARTGMQTPSPPRPSLLDPYETLIRELVGRYPDLTVTRLLEELRSRGFTGGYTIVRQKLRELRPRAAQQPVVRFETAPGAQAQMDYSSYELEFTEEGRCRVNLFSYLLSYSRRQYLRFVEAQDFATTVQQHVRAFEHLGGVAASCLYDNMKVVVSGHDGEIPIYNPQFLAFATHYGFRPVACQPRRPQTKGKVERQFFYVETNLLNGRTFRSLEHLNEVTVGWLRDTADARIHRQTGQSPRERHAAEAPHLIPLPAAHYEVAPVVYRTVSVEGFIVWRQNEYSVPWRYLGQVLPVRITADEVIGYSPQLEEVARHRLFSRGLSGQRAADSAHHPPMNDGRQRLTLLKERYQEMGPVAVQFLDGLFRTQRYNRDQAQRVLGLLGTYARADFLAALERAVRYGAYAAPAVERILAAQARPKGLWALMAEEERSPLPSSAADAAAVQPRPTSEYQPLLPEEPAPDEPPRPRPAEPPASEECPF
jgi:transposase